MQASGSHTTGRLPNLTNPKKAFWGLGLARWPLLRSHQALAGRRHRKQSSVVQGLHLPLTPAAMLSPPWPGG